jgi:hypothetical protein
MLTCSCGFTCDRANNLQTHRESKQHEKNMQRLSKQINMDETGMYSCESCKYSTSLKANYRKHMLTSKHKKTIEEKKEEVNPVLLLEVMDMFFKHQTEILKTQTEIIKVNACTSERQQIQHTEMFKALTDRVMAHQQQQQMIVPQNVIVDQENTQHINITKNNIMNSHNKKFNLNLFLNEDCKNAPNLSDFVKNVAISLEDLEHLGEVGYTQGMSKILSKAMQSKETTERPIHCTDVKRETIYIRENDEWKKDTEREETVKAIEYISHKNYKVFMEWRNQHPEHSVPDTEDYDTWYRISRNMCNTDPLALKKLVHHLATITAIEKGELVAI